MSFNGYKLKTKLHAAHIHTGQKMTDLHFHSFVLVLYLQKLSESTEFFYDTEREIAKCLSPYQNKELPEFDIFNGIPTDLESLGDVFFGLLHKKVETLNLNLVKLEIYENPVTSYAVSDKILDADVNEIGSKPYYFTDTIEFLKENGKEEAAAADQAVQEEEMAVTEQTDGTVPAAPAIGEQTNEDGDKQLNKAEIRDTSQDEEEVPKKKKSAFRPFFILGALLVLAAGAAALVYCMWISKNYPQGSDTLCHLYRADLLWQSIKNGTFYPLYDSMWYNGVEVMRYWAPIPLYILAGLRAVGGSVMNGYLLFVGTMFFLSGVGFLLLGIREKHILLSLSLGIFWFFLPENMRLVIMDGNLPRVVINTAMPFLILLVLRIVEDKKRRAAYPLVFLTAFIALCHIGIALMVTATLLLFLAFYGKMNRCFAYVKTVLCSVGIGFLLTGIWLIPSLIGSGAGNASGGNQVMKNFFESAFVSLNPLPRIEGDLSYFYYGISLVLLAIFGVLFGTKKTRPGFATGLIIFLCTTKSVYTLFEKLPFSQFLWMIRFVTISSAFLLAAFISVKRLKKWVVFVLCLLLLFDCIPSIRYVYTKEENRGEAVETTQKELGDKLLLTQAKEITTQRMAVFDLSSYGSFAPFYITGVDRKVPYTFGAGWEGARTAENIMRLNTAVEGGHYAYVFDRSISLGNDTLLFDISKLAREEHDINALILEANRQGYKKINQTNQNILFRREVDETFGVISNYTNLAIGNAAKDIALVFPSFEEGNTSIDEYTYEELAKYKKIFLSDFTYTDKEQTEELLTKLSQDGVRIFIDMNKVPVNKKTNLQEIFGVEVQEITFLDSFPTIYYEETAYETRGFVSGMEQWRAKYLISLQKITGSGEVNGISLPFTGNNGNENIIFLGYNFAYYTEISNDKTAVELLSKILGEDPTKLPERELVPILVRRTGSGIEFESGRDGVNTTYADIDIFRSDREYRVKNHLIEIDAGKTVIRFQYPYFVPGLLVSLFGVILFLLFTISLTHRKKEEKVQKGTVEK